MTRVLYIKEINGDTSFQHVTLTIVDVSVDIFVNEDGKELGRVSNKGIREQKKEKQAKDTETADLEVNMLFDKAQADANQEIKFTIIAKNNGPSKATEVEVEDILPDGYLFQSAEPTKGKWQSFIWTIGDMEVGAEEKLVMVAKVLGKGDVTHQAKIRSLEYDRYPTNNTIKTGNRVFVVKTIDKNFDSGAPWAGISKKEARETEEFIINNLQNKDVFTPDCIAYRNTVQIASEESTRKDMVKIVEQDDGTGGSFTEKPQNNREYGGVINKNGEVKESKQGEIIDLSKASYASVSIISKDDESIFHSHPSGTLGEDEKKNNSAFSGSSVPGFGGGTETKQYSNAPSNKFIVDGKMMGDIATSENGTIKYVFARRNKVVYIYNNLGVLATLPHKYFINFKK